MVREEMVREERVREKMVREERNSSAREIVVPTVRRVGPWTRSLYPVESLHLLLRPWSRHNRDAGAQT